MLKRKTNENSKNKQNIFTGKTCQRKYNLNTCSKSTMLIPKKTNNFHAFSVGIKYFHIKKILHKNDNWAISVDTQTKLVLLWHIRRWYDV